VRAKLRKGDRGMLVIEGMEQPLRVEDRIFKKDH
jgi:hypothetical protein